MERKKISCEIFTTREKAKIQNLQSIFNGIYYDKANKCAVSSDCHIIYCSKKEYKEEFANKIISQLDYNEIFGKYPNYREILPKKEDLLDIEINCGNINNYLQLETEINKFWSTKHRNIKFKYCVSLINDIYFDMFYVYNVILPLGIENWKLVKDANFIYYNKNGIEILCLGTKYFKLEQTFSEHIGMYNK